MKRREGFVGAREDGDLLAVLVELAAGQRPHGHAVRQRIEIGARTATTQTHRRVSLIEHLRDNRASRPSHGRRHAFIDSRDRLAKNESLPGMGEQEDDFRIEREIGKRSVDDVSHLTLHYRDSRDFLFAHVIKSAHGLKGFLKFGLMRC